jgi:hypothetical protein
VSSSNITDAPSVAEILSDTAMVKELSDVFNKIEDRLNRQLKRADLDMLFSKLQRQQGDGLDKAAFVVDSAELASALLAASAEIDLATASLVVGGAEPLPISMVTSSAEPQPSAPPTTDMRIEAVRLVADAAEMAAARLVAAGAELENLSVVHTQGNSLLSQSANAGVASRSTGMAAQDAIDLLSSQLVADTAEVLTARLVASSPE